MTCKDIMTPDPSCCLPSDSVSIAAEIMRRNDVGPVLVVSDHHENRLVGIVTDRDLALKVIADARDPHTTRVDEVMSINPVFCRQDDDTQKALQLMADNQVRRIPIVDENERLVGIVAQADIARHEDEEDVGRMVEQISEPYGSSSWTEVRGSSYNHWTGGSSFALGALCMAAGAGLMYVLDPTRGRTRRARIRGKGSELADWSTEALRDRTSGWRFERSREEGPTQDSKLVAQIRSKMGRKVSYPGAIQVSSSGGHVTVSGPILADEVRSLLDCVNGIEGVRSVESRLDVHDYAGSHPGLQGQSSQGDQRPLGLIVGLVGGGLLVYGMRSKIAGSAYGRQSTTWRRGEVPGY